MTSFQITPGSIAPLPGRLRGLGDHITSASTLSSPDTGATTQVTAAAVSRISAACTGANDSLRLLAGDLEAALVAYEETDGEVGAVHDRFLQLGLG